MYGFKCVMISLIINTASLCIRHLLRVYTNSPFLIGMVSSQFHTLNCKQSADAVCLHSMIRNLCFIIITNTSKNVFRLLFFALFENTPKPLFVSFTGQMYYLEEFYK